MKTLTQREVNKLLDEIRKEFVKYRDSEGCSCCQNTEDHDKATEALAKLLKVQQYSDRSGWDFTKPVMKK